MVVGSRAGDLSERIEREVLKFLLALHIEQMMVRRCVVPMGHDKVMLEQPEVVVGIVPGGAPLNALAHIRCAAVDARFVIRRLLSRKSVSNVRSRNVNGLIDFDADTLFDLVEPEKQPIET